MECRYSPGDVGQRSGRVVWKRERGGRGVMQRVSSVEPEGEE